MLYIGALSSGHVTATDVERRSVLYDYRNVITKQLISDIESLIRPRFKKSYFDSFSI
jgi:outer membrane lipopolysaccharide assembly protein LptE/RlpB